MLTYDSKFEVEFNNVVAPALEGRGVTVLRAELADLTNVLTLVMRIPANSSSAYRREVLELLDEFEHRFDYAVVTDPAFVWDDADN